MRLKEDKTSWRATSIQRRDFRHDGSDGSTGKPKRKKQTKRWCKGKQGREHQIELRVSQHAKMLHDQFGAPTCDEGQFAVIFGGWHCGHERHCIVCGKILDYWLPKEDCPAWIRDHAKSET